MGYFIAGIIELVTTVASAPLFVISLSIHSGFCKFLNSFASDLKVHLCQLNESYTRNTKKISKAKIREQLCDIIQFHCDARQLSYSNFISRKSFFRTLNILFELFFRFMKKYSNLNGPIIFVYMVFSLVSLCCLSIQINAVSISFLQILLECFGPPERKKTA